VSHKLQSKATEQQEQIAELGRRVAELEVERADLASRNAMLQKLATIRGDGAAAAADTVHERMGPQRRRVCRICIQGSCSAKYVARVSVLSRTCCMQQHHAGIAPSLRPIPAWRLRALLLCRHADACVDLHCISRWGPHSQRSSA
jgi:hypothetical protein